MKNIIHNHNSIIIRNNKPNQLSAGCNRTPVHYMGGESLTTVIVHQATETRNNT